MTATCDEALQCTAEVEADLRVAHADLVALRAQIPQLVHRRNVLLVQAISAGLTQAYVAGMLGLSPGRVTQIVAEIANQGLIA
jgi:DNA-directed RNA polymerase specialized sigma subunit